MSINPNQAIICPQGCGQYVFANMSKTGSPYYTQTVKQPTGKPEFHQCPNYQPQQTPTAAESPIQPFNFSNVPPIQPIQTPLPQNPFPIQAQPQPPTQPQGLNQYIIPTPEGNIVGTTPQPIPDLQPETQPVQEGWNELVYSQLKTISLHLAEMKESLRLFSTNNSTDLKELKTELIDLGVSKEDWEKLFGSITNTAAKSVTELISEAANKTKKKTT